MFRGKRTLVGQGKTKKIWQVGRGLCLMESLDIVTKMDDPDLTVPLEGKGIWSTATTCAAMQLLHDAGLPVAFHSRVGKRMILAPLCRMLPVECVSRRKGTGSYCKRNPTCKSGTTFPELLVEFFAKTTGGGMQPFKGGDRMQIMPPNPKNKNSRPDDDPIILNPYDPVWVLADSKAPSSDESSIIKTDFDSRHVLPEGVTIERLEELTRRAFLVMEGAFNRLGWCKWDFKIEFGVDEDGKLFIADVIDADSWRAIDEFGNQISKQIWRDNAPIEKLAEVYRRVASNAPLFTIPKQEIIVWRTVDIPEFNPSNYTHYGAKVNVIDWKVESETDFADLHGSIARCPAGGVIITAGSSVSMAARLARETTWPIIDLDTAHTVPPMNCTGPMVSMCGIDGAMQAAERHLAATNPALYMNMRYAMEMAM